MKKPSVLYAAKGSACPIFGMFCKLIYGVSKANLVAGILHLRAKHRDKHHSII